MEIALDRICVDFPGFRIADFSMCAPSGSFVSIVGPSGSGKTTVLRAIAGLEKVSSGRVLLGNEDVTLLAPEQRNAGIVFQQDSLFPHMDVHANVAFGPKMKGLGGAEEIDAIVSEALGTVRLSGFGTRSPGTLSGGERRRVAIARAIAARPAVLLLDEPMNGLDAKLKEKMKLFLRGLQRNTGLTIVMVTHDLDEAFFLSDQIVVIDNGRVQQSGSPEKIFLKPRTGFVKEFVSDYVLAEATQGGRGSAEAKFSFPLKGKGGKFLVALKKTNYRPMMR